MRGIIRIALTVRGTVPGIDADTFATKAAEAKAGCPFSALIKASATVSVNATLEGI